MGKFLPLVWNQPNPFTIARCTYNGERFLDEQLCSLRVQEGVAEIIVADDGSTDGTMAILERHAAEDARIRVSRNQARLGWPGLRGSCWPTRTTSGWRANWRDSGPVGTGFRI